MGNLRLFLNITIISSRFLMYLSLCSPAVPLSYMEPGKGNLSALGLELFLFPCRKDESLFYLFILGDLHTPVTRCSLMEQRYLVTGESQEIVLVGMEYHRILR